VLYAVPTMLYTLIDYVRAHRPDISNLKLIMYGASPAAPARVKEALELFGPILCQNYGQSEAPSSIMVLRQCDHVADDLERLSSCGMPYSGVQVELLDNACNPVPKGETGEICVRGPIVMSGYWKKPELTEEALRGGWLHTGDLARQDAHGYYFIVGRSKDMIISGGFNVYPKEVENVISAHPAVAAAAVIGVPDPKWGEAVKAVIVVRDGATLDAEEIISLVREKKGPVYAPKSVDFVDKIPVTSLGKPDKAALKKKYWSDQVRSVN
jgi:fatty-acyl-CoA synthase